jgi:hypothetical protein
MNSSAINERLFFIFVFFGLQVLLLSCRKEEIVLSDTIEVGEEAGMQVEFYNNSILSSDLTQNDKSFYLDVNQDGVNDLRIRHRSASSTTFGITSELSFNSLHTSMKLLTVESLDSVYVNYGTQFTQNQFGDSIIVNANSYSCLKANEQSILHSVEAKNQLLPKSNGESLSLYERFVATNCFVLRMDSASVLTTGNFIGNAEVFEMNRYQNSCVDFPAGSYKYVCFRFDRKDEIPLLGWIRLKLQGSQLFIDRHAIQTMP